VHPSGTGDNADEGRVDTGMAFTSGTSITMVQLVVPGSATSVTPFDYCFLGLAVQ
jgi:hypothetical protein